MKHLKKILVLALVTASLFAIVLPASAAYTDHWTTTYVWIRSTAQVRDDNKQVQVNSNTKLSAEYYGMNAGYEWHRVNYNGNNWWIQSQYLTTQNPNGGGGNPGGDTSYGLYGGMSVPLTTFFVKTYVYIRSSPVNGSIVGQTGGPTESTVYCEAFSKLKGSDGYCWYRVQMGANYNYIIGYVRGDMLYGT